MAASTFLCSDGMQEDAALRYAEHTRASMRLLLLDTCGETGSLALAEGGDVLRERILPARTASAHLVAAVREEMERLAWPLRSLEGVGVVNGPGSFTGVRVGLAAAKGICEVAQLPLVTVSRLEVLLATARSKQDTVAVLDAGRGEFYVRWALEDTEQLLGLEQLLTLAAARQEVRVLITEEKLRDVLEPLEPEWIAMSAACSLTLITERRGSRTESVAAADANYVRHARTLYAAARTAPERERT